MNKITIDIDHLANEMIKKGYNGHEMCQDGWNDAILFLLDFDYSLEYKLIEAMKIIPKRKVVKVGEISYYEDELEKALKNIKPIGE